MKFRLSSLNIQLRIDLKSMDYREALKSEMEISSFLIDDILGVDKNIINSPKMNLVRALVIMCARSAIHHLGPMPRFVFKFIRISVDGENIENDMKMAVWTENILSVFGAKTPF